MKNYLEGCPAPALLVLNLTQRQESWLPKSAMSNIAREL
jgi:NADH:ubiquinone oxidoreductase subunit E